MKKPRAQDKDLRAIAGARQFQAGWYRDRYPDVALSGIDPATHYFHYGAALGRQPGSGFDAKFYLETYPHVAESGENPLLHFLRQGREAGYLALPPQQEATRKQLGALRARLLTDADATPVAGELARIAAEPGLGQSDAGRDLALWHVRQGDLRKGYETAIAALARGGPLPLRQRLTNIALFALAGMGEIRKAYALIESTALDGSLSADAYLVMANLAQTPERRIAWINQALARSRIAALQLLPDSGQELYDRLTVAAPPPVTDGPLVTVLLAAYEAQDQLPTALRALQAQSWRNLEVIVLDDCSPTGGTMEVATAFAARDPRFRAVRLPQNGGAYVARNHGLDLARGEFITLHDADDWSHPAKIEMQMRHMLANPDTMGCTSQQARCSDALLFHRLRGTGAFIVANTSSFLWRKEPVHAAIGYWDRVRFGADNEFIRRMQRAFEATSYQALNTGPLSFQREAQSSITRDPVKGLHPSGGYYGIRRFYHLAQIHHYRSASTLRYENDPAARPFPVPPMMTEPGEDAYFWQADLAILADLSAQSPHHADVISAIDTAAKTGKTVALIEGTGKDGVLLPPSPEVMERILAGKCRLSIYGERVLVGDIVSFAPTPYLRFAPHVALAKDPGQNLLPVAQDNQ